MQAMRIFKEPRNHQVVIDLPPELRAAARVEVIVLSADPDSLLTQERATGGDEPTNIRRRPSPRVAQTRVIGDLVAPAAPEDEWSVLR